MNKNILSLALILSSIICDAQISFEEGYFINNDGQRIECFINNKDWLDNPQKFKYRLTEFEDLHTASLSEVKEFGIINSFKYKRYTVDIDRASEWMDELSDVKEPRLNEETLFLKVLVEGKASLYYYVENDLRRFFYEVENKKIEQLIFKSYRISANKFGQNNTFRQQLYVELKCPDFSKNYIENISYEKSDLLTFFVKYNECNNSNNTIYEKNKKSIFNLNIRPGIDYTSLTDVSPTPSLGSKFGPFYGFRIGLEAESIMSFNNFKWALIFEPYYRHLNTENQNAKNKLNLKYNTIVFPVGVRYYMHITEKSKVFINAFYVLDYNLNSQYNNNVNDILPYLALTHEFGLGYKYNKRYTFELRTSWPRYFESIDIAYSNNNCISFILGYSVL